MGKNKKRERSTNPLPFLNDDDATVISKFNSKAPKHHQQQDKMISSGMSSKILKEAMIQQREIAEEEIDERRPDRAAFARLEEDGRGGVVGEEEEEDVYVSDEKSELGIELDDYETDEEEERLMESFGLLNVGPQRTLADVIAERIKQTDAAVSSEMQPTPKFDSNFIDIYKRVGKVLSQFTSGKIPKPFKHIPSMEPWEEVLYLTEPEKWTPNAVFAATKIFASNMGVKKAERFYRLVLLPHVREDIRKNKRLHFWLTKSLLKALYKPAAFNRGFLLPLCESRTCTVREAYIIRSVLREARIPPLHASVALLKLAQMEFCGTTSFFIKVLIEKKHSLPYRVLDGLVDHFMRFFDDRRVMPVIWHQTLLAFVHSFKHELTKEDKVNLSKLVQRQKHYLITPEILKELSESRNRGEKPENNMQMCHHATILYSPRPPNLHRTHPKSPLAGQFSPPPMTTEKKKILIIGGTGYLGQHLLHRFSSDTEHGFSVAFTYHSTPPEKLLEALPRSVVSFFVDLRSGEGFESVAEGFGQPDVVINCAALSVPRACEADPAAAMAINVPTALLNWLSSFQEKNTVVIQLSTDQVYEGVKSFYKEEDETLPVNVYGKSKVEAEKLISSGCSNFVILRSSIIFGPQTLSPVPKSLPVLWMDGVLSKGTKADFFHDEFRCPIYVKDLVAVILTLTTRWFSEGKEMQLILNVGGPDRVSRVQMAEAVAHVRGHSTSLINSVSASSLDRGVKSPADISMDISELKNTLNISPVGFVEGVRLTLES
ncbi:hypothetical protein Droror1_Dr00000489 [Drosera rotundifolia]